MDIQRIRNITTGIIHTSFEEMSKDIQMITGIEGVTTIGIPYVGRLAQLFLKEQFPDPRFWERAMDETHVGELEVRNMTMDDRQRIFEAYRAEEHAAIERDVQVQASLPAAERDFQCTFIREPTS